MRRRALLTTCAALGFAGCLGVDSSAETPAVTDTAAGQTDDSSPTGVAIATDSATETATPTDPSTATGAVADAPTDTPTNSPTDTPIHADYETTEVRMVTSSGEELAAVTAAIADTQSLRYTGLSETEELPEDRGMLFVYDEVGDHTYVMREMDFGIDIIYADDEGVITKIHHAPEPGPDEDGENQRYPGRGQYVLEVNFEFTEDHGIEEGDILEFEL